MHSGHLTTGFWVGDWLVEPSLNRMTREHEDVAVEPKVMEVLVCLAEQPGRTVTKDYFFETVWSGMVVTEDVLSRCISELRKNLRDDSRDPHYIETIRKTGYRLLAPVIVREPGAAPDQRRRQPPNEAPATASTVTGNQSADRERAPGRSRLTTRLLLGGVLAVIVLLGSYAAYSRFATPPEVDVPSPPPSPVTTPFTSLPGLEVDPEFSPDGLKIAFASDNNDLRSFDIYIKQEGSDQALRLTENPADERYPAWSPDGLHLAFIRTEKNASGVFTIPSLGGQERRIADFGGRQIRGLTWSPDGSRLAASVQWESFGAYSILLLSVDSASVASVTTPPRHNFGDVDPVFSPDGKSIAFARGVSEDVQDVFVQDLGTPSQIRRLTLDGAAIAGLDWTPDSRSIVFASLRGHVSGLWRVDAAGGGPVSLGSAVPGATYESPSVSKDGGRLTYVHRTSNVNIWRLFKPRGFPGLRARPAVFSTHWDSHPDISPDGRRLAFASAQSGYREIWIADPDGANAVQLTSTQGVARVPKWSPDGNQLAFQLHRDGQADVYLVDTGGGAVPLRVTSSPSEDTVPVWAPDGESIYFSSNRSGRWEIWRMPSAGGEAEQVTRDGGRFCMPSKDGLSLYVVRTDTTGIWMYALGSEREPRRVYADLDPRDWANWSIAPSGVYFIQRLAHAPALSFYGFRSGKITRLQTLDEVPSHPALAVARDLSWFAYTQIDDEGSDIMVLANFQ